MHEAIVISGFGGQGVLFAGQILAYAGLAEGRHVTWIPSYGPEMRGGTAHCTVIVADDEIGSPLVRRPTTALVLNPPSLDRYAPLVLPGGVLILNSELVQARSGRADIQEWAIPAQSIAGELGFPQTANMVLLGTLIAATGVIQLDTAERVLADHLSARHRDALAANQQALRRGAALVERTRIPSLAATFIAPAVRDLAAL